MTDTPTSPTQTTTDCTIDTDTECLDFLLDTGEGAMVEDLERLLQLSRDLKRDCTCLVTVKYKEPDDVLEVIPTEGGLAESADD